jgi:hypothetical protein
MYRSTSLKEARILLEESTTELHNIGELAIICLAIFFIDVPSPILYFRHALKRSRANHLFLTQNRTKLKKIVLDGAIRTVQRTLS